MTTLSQYCLCWSKDIETNFIFFFQIGGNSSRNLYLLKQQSRQYYFIPCMVQMWPSLYLNLNISKIKNSISIIFDDSV